MVISVACLAIETLESFYQGRPDTKNESKQMFRGFFKRETPLRVFGVGGDWFYTDIRCGLLHQAEARGGRRIRRNGALFDQVDRTINATAFLREVQRAVGVYARHLEQEDESWRLFRGKMKTVCANCA